MGCNRYKNKNYKSALQYFNTVAQPIVATDIVSNPVIVDLGGTVTDTGCAFDFNGRSFSVDNSGLYEFNNEISILGVTAGDVTVGMILDGIIIPETLRTQTLVAGATVTIPISDVRQVITCCNLSNRNSSLIVYSDGTATGTITRVSGNAVKLA